MNKVHRWILPSVGNGERPAALAAELGISGWLVELLGRRGFADPMRAAAFLRPRLNALSDPFLLEGMEGAVTRLLAAIDVGERIVLYGDYDVDGVSSVALGTRVLRALGAEVRTFLPRRMDEGYGLSADGIRRCVATLAPRLLIAVDCGTSSAAEIAALGAEGIEVIVIDHHEAKATRPECAALVNPKAGEAGEFRYFCSVGLVFKLCHALLKRRPVPGFDLRDYLDLVALGTVADLVPLEGENRILVQKGLRQLERPRWPGVRALMRVAGVRGPLRPGQIGFALGPRLNAAGRLASAEAALELLLTDDEERAGVLAGELDAQNRERQATERALVVEAERQLAGTFDPETEAAIVLGGDGWHAGVLGIVASRIARAHYRPTIVIGFDENGVGKGSGRSIEGLSLVAALGNCSGFLEKFGGHEMAAGLTIRREQFAEFRAAFLREARAILTDELLQPCVRPDAEIALREVDFDFLAQLELLQPCGLGNRQPLLLARGVRLAGEPRILKEKHLRLPLVQNGASVTAMFFNGVAAMPLPASPWDMAFRVERNEWEGRVSVQIEIECLRAAER